MSANCLLRCKLYIDVWIRDTIAVAGVCILRLSTHCIGHGIKTVRCTYLIWTIMIIMIFIRKVVPVSRRTLISLIDATVPHNHLLSIGKPGFFITVLGTSSLQKSESLLYSGRFCFGLNLSWKVPQNTPPTWTKLKAHSVLSSNSRFFSICDIAVSRLWIRCTI